MPEIIRVFTGFDQREAVGWHVFVNSLRHHASVPVAIIPISDEFAEQRDGSNLFTYSRFLVPWLCGYQGWAVYADGADMLMNADIAELWKLRDEAKAVQVVKHNYKTKEKTKYVGTDMETINTDYPRKNWSSVVLWNCGHPKNNGLNREFVNEETYEGHNFLHGFSWLKDEDIGELPKEWNWLADEYGMNGDVKIFHWTRGIPAFTHYCNAPYAKKWFDAMKRTSEGLQSLELNGRAATAAWTNRKYA